MAARPLITAAMLALAMGAGIASEVRAEKATPPEAGAKQNDQPPLWHQLPTRLRREMPAAHVTVHYYNPDRDKRFIKVNGTRAAEGETIADQFWIREIRPDSIVFEFKGQRFVLDR